MRGANDHLPSADESFGHHSSVEAQPHDIACFKLQVNMARCADSRKRVRTYKG